MLRGIRKASGNWLGKVVMIAVVGFLIVSFAVWGIGDIFRGFGRATVAKVGGVEITTEQFRQILTERLQQLGSQVGRPITPDQARTLGIDRQILSQVIADAALDERARQLGLGIADTEVARQIQATPAFQGAGNRFDRAIFEQRIRSAGYTEQRFIAEQRRFMIRNQLTDSVSGDTVAPKTVIEALNRFQNERRAIEYVMLDRAQAGEVPQPTPEEIASYFERHKAQFRAPEYRKLVLLTLSPAEVAKWLTVTDEDARRTYDEQRSRYMTAGRRHLQQIIFPNADEARAAKARIDSGVEFATVAQDRGLSEKDIDLGFVGKTTALAPAVSEAAFALPKGGVSGPVQARAGTALVRVIDIEPDRVRTFEEAAPEIKQTLARERTRSEIDGKHDKIEDERAAGQTLAEVAQKIGLQATTIEAVDQSGRDPSGAPALGLPAGVEVLGPAFSTEAGVETDPLRLADGGYLWFEVVEITRARERNLDEVREAVEARWREEQIGTRLKVKAEDLIGKLKAGGTLAEAAAAAGLKVETASDLQRGRSDERISPATVDAVFRTAKGAAGSADGQSAAERIVFRVTETTVAPLDPSSPQGRDLHDKLRTALASDLLGQYIAQVERDVGTTINQDALRRMSGGEPN